MVSWTVSSLAGGTAISVTFSVTAATTITNSDYAATADGGGSAADQAAVTTQVYPSLVPDFTASPLSGPAPLAVTFSNSSAGATSYRWDYGDGITGTTTTPTHVHTYTQAGVYTVTLTASDGITSQTQTRPGYITVTPPAGFPATGILDDFNRAGGAIGGNWSGTTAGYSLVSNQLEVNSGGDIYWQAAVFGPDQEVFVTLSDVGANGQELGLVLKAQSSSGYSQGLLEVFYDPVNEVVEVWTYTGAQGWLQRGMDIPAAFADGDRLGARATAAGQVEVYRNGTLLAARDVTAWPYYANGGYIGLFFINANTSLLDDFGGGAVGESPVPVAAFTASPLIGPAPLVVTFTNSSANATEYVWAYGDGITSTIAATSHVYTYTQAGVYTVTLTASNGMTSQTQTRPAYITVTTAITRNWQEITTATTLPPVVGEHGLAYDSSRGVFVLYGGNTTGWPYEDLTWELDDAYTDWISKPTTTRPAARYGAGLAYDAARGVTVLFGGSDKTDTALAQTWEFSGTDWIEAPQVTSPPARTYPGIATNPISGTVYLFGGNDGEQAYDDLWKYENGEWTDISPGGAVPPARTMAALAYDSANGRLLLFGGRGLTGTILADFWEYNFSISSWNPIDDPGGGPPARMAHSLTYDPATGNTVLVGGIALDGETVLTDTWHYNGGWSEVNPSASPPRPAYHQAVYHDNAIILFSDGEVWKYE